MKAPPGRGAPLTGGPRGDPSQFFSWGPLGPPYCGAPLGPPTVIEPVVAKVRLGARRQHVCDNQILFVAAAPTGCCETRCGYCETRCVYRVRPCGPTCVACSVASYLRSRRSVRASAWRWSMVWTALVVGPVAHALTARAQMHMLGAPPAAVVVDFLSVTVDGKGHGVVHARRSNAQRPHVAAHARIHLSVLQTPQPQTLTLTLALTLTGHYASHHARLVQLNTLSQ
jgi:hypothetical protein